MTQFTHTTAAHPGAEADLLQAARYLEQLWQGFSATNELDAASNE